MSRDMTLVNQTRLLRALSNLALNVSRDGASTTARSTSMFVRYTLHPSLLSYSWGNTGEWLIQGHSWIFRAAPLCGCKPRCQMMAKGKEWGTDHKSLASSVVLTLYTWTWVWWCLGGSWSPRSWRRPAEQELCACRKQRGSCASPGTSWPRTQRRRRGTAMWPTAPRRSEVGSQDENVPSHRAHQTHF